MDLKIALSGDLPARCSDALAALAPELGMVPAAEGVPVRGHRGAALAVCCDGASVTIEWAQPIQFYRALSLLPRPLAACDIREEPCFETVGMMFDTSRNAVLRPDTLRSFLRKMALMGMNLGMMYTEDTYEVPGQPYLGYQRGRYTYEELHALDDYADMLGIELCPCVQTLGHLNRALHWPAMRRLQDNDEVLLADSEETYSFLRQILTAASAPYRSKRIHIGMDEAHGVGMGAHLRLHGYEKPYDILRRHLKRVLDIVNELGLSPMMWSDMYFRLESPTNGYYDGPMPSQQAVDAVVPGVELVYWDYYHMREAEYDEQLKSTMRCMRPRCSRAVSGPGAALRPITTKRALPRWPASPPAARPGYLSCSPQPGATTAQKQTSTPPCWACRCLPNLPTTAPLRMNGWRSVCASAARRTPGRSGT